MRLPKLVLVVVLSFGASLQVGAQAPTVSDVERRIFELEKRFREIYERDIRTSHDTAVADLESKYLAALERNLEAAVENGNLDRVVQFRDEIRRLKEKAPLPATDEGVVGNLGRLRGTFREHNRKLVEARERVTAPLVANFDAELVAYQFELTKAKQIEAAVEVKTYRESGLAAKLAPDVAAAPAVDPAPETPAEPEPAHPTESGPRMAKPEPATREEHDKAVGELIGWALAAKYDVELRVDGNRKILRDGIAMPDGDFDLIAIKIKHGTTERPSEPFPWHAVGKVPELESLRWITPVAPVTAEHLAHLASAKLKQLEFCRANFAEGAMLGLPDLPELTGLSIIFGSGVDREGIPHLAERCPNLQQLYLKLGGAPWTADLCEHLCGFKDLKSLTLEGQGELTDAICLHLSTFRHLNHFGLEARWSATPEAVSKLDESKKLTSIRIKSKQLFPVFPDILRLGRLERLDLSYCGIGDAELAVVGANAGSKLKTLVISSNNGITDDGIAHLSTLSQLETLVLGKGASGITDAGVEALAKKLRRCDIRR